MSTPAASEPLLKLDRCTIRFGGLTAVNALDLHIGANELVGLIGPNGAGKTTVFNLITGVYAPTEGRISFCEQSLENHLPHQITAKGIARTFQNIRLFPSLTVFDHVRMARQLHQRGGFRHSLWRGPAFRERERQVEAEVMEMLDIFRLGRADKLHSTRHAQVNALLTKLVACLAEHPAKFVQPL